MAEAKKYTALDIERYHHGKLTPAEMNALEKAALEDPFLAEAIEGYRTHGVVASSDMELLNERLSKRITTSSKPGARLFSMPWFRAAAMILFLAGAGLLVYQFAFNNGEKEIVSLGKDPQRALTDSATPGTSVNPEFDAVATNKTTGKIDSLSGNIVNNGKPDRLIPTGTNEDQTVSGKTVEVNSGESQPVAQESFPAIARNDQKLDAPAKETQKQKLEDKKITADNEYYQNENMIGNKSKRAGPSRQLQANYFRGRVTDLNNNPVPFANIMNTRDNTATYSDANGNFNIVSPDTVMDIQVRSVGYELSNARLKDVNENRVVLQDDKSPLAGNVISNANVNTERRSMIAEKKSVAEPEPVDGWKNYDTYLINNLIIPDQIKSKDSPIGEVEVSFEINKSGKPVNIKIERSLCPTCDAEAIRLVRQGPSWKRSGKKTRGRVTIPFTHYHQ